MRNKTAKVYKTLSFNAYDVKHDSVNYNDCPKCKHFMGCESERQITYKIMNVKCEQFEESPRK